MAVVKLNEAMLFQMGFDRVAIDALRHLYTQVGSEVGAPTLPQVSESVVTVITQVEGIDQGPPAYIPPPAVDQINGDQSPPPQPFLPGEQLDQRPSYEALAAQQEFIETQIRSLAEQLVAVSRRLTDIEQGASL